MESGNREGGKFRRLFQKADAPCERLNGLNAEPRIPLAGRTPSYLQQVAGVRRVEGVSAGGRALCHKLARLRLLGPAPRGALLERGAI